MSKNLINLYFVVMSNELKEKKLKKIFVESELKLNDSISFYHELFIQMCI